MAQDAKGEEATRFTKSYFSTYTIFMNNRFFLILFICINLASHLQANRLKIIDKFTEKAPKALRDEINGQLIRGYLGFIDPETPRTLSRESITFLAPRLASLLTQMPWLTHINLTSFPEAALYGEFTQLNPQHGLSCQHLCLRDCALTKFVIELSAFQQLTTLDLRDNAITTLPTELQHLPQLTRVLIQPATDVSASKTLHQTLLKVCPEYKDQFDSWFKRDIVNRFLVGAPLSLSSQMDEIVGGSLGKVLTNTDLIRASVWTDEEKAFLKTRLDLLHSLDWLTSLNLGGLKLTVLPPSVLHLLELKRLCLDDNYLTDLPSDLAGLTKLTILSMSKNSLVEIPPVIPRLTQLNHLDLSRNHLRSFHIDDEGAFKHVKTLNLGDNLIDHFRRGNSQLNPETLLLHKNRLEALFCDCDDFSQIRTLDLHMNQLTTFPLAVSLKANLGILNVSDNFIATLPGEFVSAGTQVFLLIDRNPGLDLSPVIAELENTLDLMTYIPFSCPGESSDIDAERHACRTGPYQTIENFFEAYSEREMSWDPEILSTFQCSPLPPQDVTPETVLTNWDTLWTGINFTREEHGDTYQDFVLYEPYLRTTQKPIPENGSNQEKMEKGILPHIRGFLKTLFDLPLSEDETTGWQIDASQKTTMQHYAAYLIREMKDTQNLALFTQFVIAILVCPTGQKTAFETMILNTTSGPKALLENTENLETIIGQRLALEKEKAFVLVTNQPEHDDNEGDHSVHLIEHYKRQLRDHLGLTNQMATYRDISTLLRVEDLFHGNNVKALEAFYTAFTPESFIDILLDMTETTDDRELLSQPHRTADHHAAIRKAKKERPITLTTLMNYLHEHNIVPYSDYDRDISEVPFLWESYFTHNPTTPGMRVDIKREIYLTILEQMGLIFTNFRENYTDSDWTTYDDDVEVLPVTHSAAFVFPSLPPRPDDNEEEEQFIWEEDD